MGYTPTKVCTLEALDVSMKFSSQRFAPLVEAVLLIAILALAFFMTSIPHWSYGYPLHIDEWWHYGDAQSLMESKHFEYPNPFDSGITLSSDIELGFHLFLAELKQITGISWLNLFRFLPGIIFVILTFTAYAFGKRKGFGLAAAFLVTLIPTTIRFLGPAFLVPVALGLTFIPLTLFTLHRLMFDLRGPIILTIVFVTLMFLHPPTLVAVSAISVIHFIFFLPRREKPKNRAWQSAIALASLVPIYIYLLLLWAPSEFDFVIREALNPEAHIALPPIQDALPKFGYIPVALSIVGTGVLVFRGGRENYALVLSAASLLAYEQIYPRFYIGPDIVYERGWLYTYVMMALLGGVALSAAWRWTQTTLQRNSFKYAVVSYASIIILIFSALILGLKSHLSEPYYQVVDDATYSDFLWIKEFVPRQYNVGVLDTGVAWAFASVSGKFAYTAEVAPNFHDKGRSAMAFLHDGARDTSWLQDRGITIVYTPQAIENSDLIKVHNNVYLLAK